jgi:hypothetical protein
MSLQPCIDQLRQRLQSLDNQIKKNEENLKDLAAKVSALSGHNIELEVMKQSTQEALDALNSLQKSKKENKDDANQGKKVTRERKVTSKNY